MLAVGIIPARYGSTRLKGKVLLPLNGKPLVQHVWERTVQAKALEHVMIATDHPLVKEACEGFGAKVVMTSPECQSGTDRIAQVVKDIRCAIVVNIQGDEPLMSPEIIDALVRGLVKDNSAPVGTVMRKITDSRDVDNPSIVKVVVDAKGFALYFSRSPIPYNRDGQEFKDLVYYKHLGIYAYRKSFLMDFRNLPKSRLEHTEKLEQLRILESGNRIKVIETTLDSIGVDTAEDLEKVRKILRGKDGTGH